MYNERWEEHAVRPEAGMVLVFYHFQEHAGEDVKAGTKLIARTEVVYSRAGH